MFKIKYCHRIFDDVRVRFYCFLFMQISEQYNMPIKKIGFDSDHVHNHVHFRIDIKLRSKPEAAKIPRGITGKKILSAFPEIKKKYFWGADSRILLI